MDCGDNSIGIVSGAGVFCQETAVSASKAKKAQKAARSEKPVKSTVKILPSGASAVSLGTRFGAVLLTDGKLSAFGANYNTLGPLRARAISAANAKANREVSHQVSPDDVQKVSPAIELSVGARITQVACGYGAHMAAVTADGALFTWGLNDSSQLGRVSDGKRPGKVELPGAAKLAACGARFTVVVLADNSVVGFGDNFHGQLAQKSSQEPKAKPLAVKLGKPGAGAVKAIAAGHFHTVVLLESGAVLTFGANTFGQLGRTVSYSKAFQPALVKLPAPAVRANAGPFATAFVTDAGEAFVAGRLMGEGLTQHVAEPRLLSEFAGKRVADVRIGETHIAVLERAGKR